MATITSVGSGLWSAAGTWNAGIPADNDVVVIAAGHVVEFNVDQSGFANGIDGITITGTLKLTRTAGTYYLKIKAAKTINGAGTFDCGASALDAIPFAAKHTITGGAAWYIQGSGGLTMTVYAAEPTNKTILLSGDEAIGQTELSVDTDVTGDIWAAGDSVRIDDINKARETEERVINTSGIASGTITITAGLTAAKSTGAIISLITRNLRFVGSGTSGHVAQNFAHGKLTIAGGEWRTTNYRALSGCTSATITGGTFSGNNNGLEACTNATITGGTFSGNTYDLRTTSGRLHNITLTSATEHYAYTSMFTTYQNCQSEDHNGVDGALKAWCKGGVVTSQVTTKPDGYTQAYLLDPESATYPVFFTKSLSVESGKSVSIEVQLRKDASMTYLPRIYLVKSVENPLAGSTLTDTFTMTNSTNTWETDTFSITNSTDYDQDYTLWFAAKNASGNVYSAYDITTQGGGTSTSSVKIMPLGRVGL